MAGDSARRKRKTVVSWQHRSETRHCCRRCRCCWAAGQEPGGHLGHHEAEKERGNQLVNLCNLFAWQDVFFVNSVWRAAVTVTLCCVCGGWQISMASSSWLSPSTLQRRRGTSVDRGARGMGIGWVWKHNKKFRGATGAFCCFKFRARWQGHWKYSLQIKTIGQGEKKRGSPLVQCWAKSFKLQSESVAVLKHYHLFWGTDNLFLCHPTLDLRPSRVWHHVRQCRTAVLKRRTMLLLPKAEATRCGGLPLPLVF